MTKPGEATRAQHWAIVKGALPCAVRTGKSFTWRLLDSGLRSTADCVASIACSPAADEKVESELTNARTPPSSTVLKRDDRKLVVRAENDDTRAVAKVFYLPRLEDRLRYHRFALNEAANLLRAHNLGIPVPRLFGYGHRRQQFLVTTSVTLMEDLVDYQPASKLILAQKTDEEALFKLLSLTIPVFTALYENACNHIDVNDDAIMLNLLDRSKAPRILDLQHAVFRDRPSTEVLMAQAGRFVSRFPQEWLQSPVEHWLEDLLDSVNIRNGEQRAKLHKRFEFYRDNNLSRAQRSRIQ